MSWVIGSAALLFALAVIGIFAVLLPYTIGEALLNASGESGNAAKSWGTGLLVIAVGLVAIFLLVAFVRFSWSVWD